MTVDEIAWADAELDRLDLADAGFYDEDTMADEVDPWLLDPEQPEPLRLGDVW